MTVSDKIRFHRKRLGLTQDELGAKLGVRKSAVSKWELGQVGDIPITKIAAMAKLFDVPPTTLVFDDPETNVQVKPIDELLHYANMLSALDLKLLIDVAKRLSR